MLIYMYSSERSMVYCYSIRDKQTILLPRGIKLSNGMLLRHYLWTKRINKFYKSHFH